jgi:hypothetical protein
MLWVDSAESNIVDKSVAITGPAIANSTYSGTIPHDLMRIPSAPYNLNFEDTVLLDQ